MNKRLLDTEEISEIDTLYKGQILPDQHENIFHTLWHYKQLAEERGKALEWYADEKNHVVQFGSFNAMLPPKVMEDNGELARQTLKEATPNENDKLPAKK